MSRSWKQFTSSEMHRMLIDRCISRRFDTEDEVGAQALFCPYYVELEGRLGSDWGVILNPKSTRFGQLTFEHDDCGCPMSEREDEFGWGRHGDTPSQDGDMWCTEWRHECDDMCEDGCGTWAP